MKVIVFRCLSENCVPIATRTRKQQQIINKRTEQQQQQNINLEYSRN